jgi:glycine betaine/choline ABC-type transport system substrate-binding protein
MRGRFLSSRARKTSTLSLLLVAAYVLLILFLLVLSLGYDAERSAWRLHAVEAESIVLALLLFLPVLLPRIRTLSFPFLTGQASIEFHELHERVTIQEQKVARLSNETDLLLNSLAANVLAPGSLEERDTVVIGCQRGLEQKLLGALLKQLLQANLGIAEDKISARYEYGGGALNFISVYRGKTDLCPAYTWQGYEMSLGPSLQYSAERLMQMSVDDTVRDLNRLYAHSRIQWLSYLGFASNWELVMLEERASSFGIQTLDDLPARSGRFVLACPREFFARDAAFGTLEREGAQFLKVQFLEGDALYDHLVEERADVIVGFSTDARLDSRLFRVLHHARPWFGEYYAVPIVGAEVLRRYPEIGECVDRLGAALDGGASLAKERIKELVRKAEGVGGSDDGVEVIAERFLRSSNLT